MIDGPASCSGELRQGTLRHRDRLIEILEDKLRLPSRYERDKVRCSKCQIAKRGTEFILSEERDSTRCLVRTGEIEVTLKNGKQITVCARQQLTIEADGKPPKPTPLKDREFFEFADQFLSGG